MLVSVENVAVVIEDKIGDGSDDTLAVGTTNQKYSRVFHW
jgi:hypothetical protein